MAWGGDLVIVTAIVPPMRAYHSGLWAPSRCQVVRSPVYGEDLVFPGVKDGDDWWYWD